MERSFLEPIAQEPAPARRHEARMAMRSQALERPVAEPALRACFPSAPAVQRVPALRVARCSPRPGLARYRPAWQTTSPRARSPPPRRPPRPPAHDSFGRSASRVLWPLAAPALAPVPGAVVRRAPEPRRVPPEGAVETVALRAVRWSARPSRRAVRVWAERNPQQVPPRLAAGAPSHQAPAH